MKRVNISATDISNSKSECGVGCAHCAIAKAVGRLKHRKATVTYSQSGLPESIEVGRQVYRTKANLSRLKSKHKKPFAVVLNDENMTAHLASYEDNVISTETIG